MLTPEMTKIIQDYLAALPTSGIHPTGAVLMGSQRTGTVTKWSDIDDLIVIAPEFDAEPHVTVVDQLWRSLVNADCQISPISCGTKEWDLPSQRPIIDIARREGVMIAPRAAA